MSAPLRVALVANGAHSLVNFRGPLIAEMVAGGAEVYALAPDFDDASRAAVGALGAIPVDIRLNRFAIRPLHDLGDLIGLALQLRRLRIDLCFSYFLKPIVIGTIAAWLAGVRRRHAMVAGLGYLFTDDGTPRGVLHWAKQQALMHALRLAFALCGTVFFQNADDRRHFEAAGTLRPGKGTLLAGTGVDLDHFARLPLPVGKSRFLFVGRLLREKGLTELVEAARMVRQAGADCTVAIAGGVDGNPGAFTQDEILALDYDCQCEWLGQVADVRTELARATVFILPSYREGKPRSTQEALAIGRPVITTDAVGCRDTVVPGENGWMVPVRDAGALATAMLDALTDHARLERMADASRAMAERTFDIRAINRTMLAEMGI